MDPLGDEVIGVRVQVSLLLEKVGRCDLAAQVLEAARNNCLEWVRDKGGADGAAGRRNRVLQKAVSLSVKLGELYADPHVGDRESAEERLVWAVETVLWEKKRRENEGVKEGEGDWMTDEEVGGSIEGTLIAFLKPLCLLFSFCPLHAFHLIDCRHRPKYRIHLTYNS